MIQMKIISVKNWKENWGEIVLGRTDGNSFVVWKE